MKTAFLFIIAAVVVQAQDPGNNTGPTPRAVECNNSYCIGKSDSNYEHPTEKHHFVQCNGGIAFCQACWPNNMYFSGKCNQCLYNYEDECYTTKTWIPVSTYNCPDRCPAYGPNYKGNARDPDQPHHYVACWEGVTVGCVNCPGDLQFNEEQNACLYDGKHYTEPTYEV